MANGKHSMPSKRSKRTASTHHHRPTLSGRRPLVFFVAAVLLVAAIFACLHFIEIPGQVDQGAEITVTIPEGAGATQIGSILKGAKVISSADAFVSKVAELKQTDSLKSGTYRFVGGASLDDIIAAIVSGKTGSTLTIPEGYTAKQIADSVEKVCGIDSDEFYALTKQANSYQSEYTFLNGAYGNSMEGFLFPDTYSVPYNATADYVVRMMLDDFADNIASVDMTYASSKNLTQFDVVTLASMVEKESRRDSDRAKIASVFYNRLHKGMTLGSDVTTYYAVGKDLSEELTQDDLNSDSPYNTRKVKGLPAGPICSPGLASLKAAAQPADTDYLYFFYSQSKDKTMFYKDQASFDAAWAKYGG